jgi:hypothetical protein
MSGWRFNTDTRKQWFRSARQVITCDGPSPVLSAEIIEMQKMADGRVFQTRVGEVNINMSELEGDDLVKAQAMQAFLTDLIGRKADPIIQVYLDNMVTPKE